MVVHGGSSNLACTTICRGPAGGRVSASALLEVGRHNRIALQEEACVHRQADTCDVTRLVRGQPGRGVRDILGLYQVVGSRFSEPATEVNSSRPGVARLGRNCLYSASL